MTKLNITNSITNHLSKSMSGFLGTDKEWNEYNKQKYDIKLLSNLPISVDEIQELLRKITDIKYAKLCHIQDDISDTVRFIENMLPLDEYTKKLDALNDKYEWCAPLFISAMDLINENYGKGRTVEIRKFPIYKEGEK